MQRKNELVRFHYGENNINTGPLKEIPEICIDHFYGDDLNSSIFFLSHAHTDHLVGLETDKFVRRLNQPGIKFYCHPLTPILLGSFQRYLGGPDGIKKLIKAKKIVPLDVLHTKSIVIPRVSTHLEVKVTLLPAGHCPGSVMFLFETPTMRILHTGDFRLTLEDLKRMPQLHINDKPKPLHHLYVDTTFCSKSANLFPDRKDVLKEAMDSIREWITISKNHVIYISFSAKFAHEYVLLELYKGFQQKIHVTPERREIYRNIPELYNCVTLDNETQLHLCGDRNCVENGKPLTLRLSSMWYTKSVPAARQNVSWMGKNLMLCYSMHSSLEEIAQTIEYLQPTIVTPLVLPIRSQVSEIENALQSVCKTSFKFEDYRSCRDDFGGDEPPQNPCEIEKDETDMGDKAMEVEYSHEDSDANIESSQDDSPKRARLDDAAKSAWQFKFSPSPQSKNSQSSSEGSQSNSQEMNSEGVEVELSPFTRPLLQPMRSNVRRNLGTVDFSCPISTETHTDSASPEFSKPGGHASESADKSCDTLDDETNYSQRL